MKKRERFILREIMGQTMFMPTGATAAKFSGLIVATETGAFIWAHIEEAETIEALTAMLEAEYDVTHEEALQDVTQTVRHFKAAGWIE